MRKKQTMKVKANYKSGDWIRFYHNGVKLYGRLLCILPEEDDMVIYVYEQESLLHDWTAIPLDVVNNEFTMKKLTYKEECMIPSNIRLASYVFNEEWLRYNFTNFELTET
jgi:hypothetical protein